MEAQQAWREKNGKKEEQTLANLNSAHRRSQAKCQRVRTINFKTRPRSRFSHTDLLLS